MPDEYENETSDFSAFWPLLILAVGLIIWFGYQDYALNTQRMAYNKQVESAMGTISSAQGIQSRYVALMKDLVQTAQKDPAAAQIVKDAIQAGLIRVQQQDTNSVANPAVPPSTSSTSSTPSTPSK